jgi:uncharacterized protein
VTKKLLDSYALLAYLGAEEGFAPVRETLSEAVENGIPLLMNEINVGETYYILFRKKGREAAEYFLHTVLAGLPISILSNTFDEVIDAARLKGEFRLSYADCFAVATALREGGNSHRRSGI